MMTSPTNKSITDLFNDFDTWTAETITLDQSHIDRAIELSDPIENEGRQWQAYLNALVMFAFEEWLLERAPEILVSRQQCSILQSQYAGLINAVCNLIVGEFKVCLMPMGAGMDEAIALNRVAVELPEYMAHFYVIVSVIEELGQAKIIGFLRYDEVLKLVKNISIQPNWTYRIPLKKFDSDADNLLLSLRCLEPTALPKPTLSTPSPFLLSQIKTKLPEFQSEKWELWEVFTWQETAILFTHPELFQPPQVKAIALLNVATWLKDKLDQVGQELAWVLLPSFNTQNFHFQAAAAMRSPIEELDDMLTQLARSGTEIPPQARGAYQNVKLADTDLRLYAVTWPILSAENIPEWQLLLVLGATQGNSVPVGTILRIGDNSGVLGERVRDRDTDPSYLYARVAGTWEETFTVTIALITGETVTLPPFAFDP